MSEHFQTFLIWALILIGIFICTFFVSCSANVPFA
jgi:hypothetical protein